VISMQEIVISKSQDSFRIPPCILKHIKYTEPSIQSWSLRTNESLITLIKTIKKSCDGEYDAIKREECIGKYLNSLDIPTTKADRYILNLLIIVRITKSAYCSGAIHYVQQNGIEHVEDDHAKIQLLKIKRDILELPITDDVRKVIESIPDKYNLPNLAW